MGCQEMPGLPEHSSKRKQSRKEKQVKDILNCEEDNRETLEASISFPKIFFPKSPISSDKNPTGHSQLQNAFPKTIDTRTIAKKMNNPAG